MTLSELFRILQPITLPRPLTAAPIPVRVPVPVTRK
jgi:hypothetical protein